MHIVRYNVYADKGHATTITFCQIVVFMFPHRSVVAGRLDCWLVAMVISPCVISKQVFHERKNGTVQFKEETRGNGRNRLAGEDHAGGVTGY